MWARMQFERWSNEAAGNEEVQERADKENNVDNVKEIGSAKAEEERGVPSFFTPLLFSFLSLFCPNSHSLLHADQTSS